MLSRSSPSENASPGRQQCTSDGDREQCVHVRGRSRSPLIPYENSSGSPSLSESSDSEQEESYYDSSSSYSSESYDYDEEDEYSWEDYYGEEDDSEYIPSSSSSESEFGQ